MHRSADLQLRGLPARVVWPVAAIRDEPPALIVCFSGSAALARGLCSSVAAVVLSAEPASLDDALRAVEWAADHAPELGADASTVVVAGEGAAGAFAAAVALHARDDGWPAIRRQLLIHPELGRAATAPVGVAPATIVTAAHGPHLDDGRRYAGRLRRAGVEVEELVVPVGAGFRLVDALGGSVRRALGREELIER